MVTVKWVSVSFLYVLYRYTKALFRVFTKIFEGFDVKTMMLITVFFLGFF